MSGLSNAILIVSLIAISFSIIAILYIILAFRRVSLAAKKFDYLVEDLTYKSELLNNTVETISRFTTYFDAFEVVAKTNIKSMIRLVSRNRDLIYSMTTKIKEVAKSTLETNDKNKSKKKDGKK